jgi:hypothetical protein
MDISQFDKIQVLLHEYDTLRNDVLQRYAASFQTVGVFALVITALITIISQSGFNKIIFCLIVSTSVIFAAMMLWIDFDMAEHVCRLRQIEADVNNRIGNMPDSAFKIALASEQS